MNTVIIGRLSDVNTCSNLEKLRIVRTLYLFSLVDNMYEWLRSYLEVQRRKV